MSRRLPCSQSSFSSVCIELLSLAEKIAITKQPESIPVTIGDRLELRCEATGVPKPEYLWFRADRFGNTIPLPRQKASQLVIEEALREHSGRYCCRVMNKYDTLYTRWVEVVIDTAQGAVGSGVSFVQFKIRDCLVYGCVQLYVRMEGRGGCEGVVGGEGVRVCAASLPCTCRSNQAGSRPCEARG